MQGLNSTFAARQSQLSDLHTCAKPLQETCEPEVTQKVNAAVEDVEVQWQKTGSNLNNLCERYHRAVELWSRYKDASEQLASWIEQGYAGELGGDAVQEVKVRLIKVFLKFILA